MRMLLLSLAAWAVTAQTPSPLGTWRGAIDTGDARINITMRVTQAADGGYAVVVDSPERNAKDAKADVVKPNPNGFTAEWKAMNVRCEAKFADGGAALDTSWESPEGAAPAVLKKEAGFDRAALIGHLERTRGILQSAIQGVTPEQAKYKPAPERWSVLEVVEHLAATEPFLLGYAQQILTSPAVAALSDEENRKADEKLLAGVVDRSKKAQAPEPAKPANRFASLDAAWTAFNAERAKSLDYVRTTQDALRAHRVEGPLGQQDAYQMILLLAAHTERHSLQIKEVMADPGYPKGR